MFEMWFTLRAVLPFAFCVYAYDCLTAILLAGHVYFLSDLLRLSLAPADPYLQNNEHVSNMSANSHYVQTNRAGHISGREHLSILVLTRQDVFLSLNWILATFFALHTLCTTVCDLVYGMSTMSVTYILKQMNMLVFHMTLAWCLSLLLLRILQCIPQLLSRSDSITAPKAMFTNWLTEDALSFLAYAACRWRSSTALNTRLIAAQCVIYTGIRLKKHSIYRRK
jgi:hypothetical protein